MKEISASEFKAKCLSILDDVRDTGEIVVILKRGKPVARLIPAFASQAAYPQLELKRSVRGLGDIVEPVLPEDDWEALRGS